MSSLVRPLTLFAKRKILMLINLFFSFKDSFPVSATWECRGIALLFNKQEQIHSVLGLQFGLGFVKTAQKITKR